MEVEVEGGCGYDTEEVLWTGAVRVTRSVGGDGVVEGVAMREIFAEMLD